MITEDLKILRAALNEIEKLIEGDEDVSSAVRNELDKISDACDNLSSDCADIEKYISIVYRMV